MLSRARWENVAVEITEEFTVGTPKMEMGREALLMCDAMTENPLGK
jgi:hypothetical protein